MNITPEEIAAAKRALAKMRPPTTGLSPENVALMKKYPRHTLEQAREIDAALPEVPPNHPGQELGYTSGFEKIIAQERGNFHLSGDHT